MVVLVVKNLPSNARDARDTSLIPGSGRYPGEGNGNLFQYFCLENSMDREAWQAKSMGSQRIGHNWAHTYRNNEILKIWKRWQLNEAMKIKLKLVCVTGSL